MDPYHRKHGETKKRAPTNEPDRQNQPPRLTKQFCENQLRYFMPHLRPWHSAEVCAFASTPFPEQRCVCAVGDEGIGCVPIAPFAVFRTTLSMSSIISVPRFAVQVTGRLVAKYKGGIGNDRSQRWSALCLSAERVRGNGSFDRPVLTDGQRRVNMLFALPLWKVLSKQPGPFHVREAVSTDSGCTSDKGSHGRARHCSYA